MSHRQPATRLMVGWLVVLALGAWSATVVVLGVRRDARAGEATIPISLGNMTDWHTVSLRVWSSGRYRLFVSTVNFDERFVGLAFQGEMQVMVRRPDGTSAFDQRFSSATMNHVMPHNYGDTTLADMTLEPARIRPWTVAVRVTRADTQFRGVRSEVKLWRERMDPGMGGLFTYVLIIPAVMFLLLAVWLSFVLARRGWRMPLVALLLITGAFFVWFMA